MGPTASGKTQLAVHLVQRFPMEIINVDSAMVYRGMDIGTAKPEADILKIAPHRLIDIRDPSEPYSAAQFCEDAVREIEDILAHGKIPLLVGGTMLYFRALQQGLSDMPSANPEVRAALKLEGEKHGLSALHERLKKIDPVAAQRIHANDAQRLQRALEVYELTGKNLTTWQQENRTLPEHFQMINLALIPEDRKVLHERIALRFQKMLDDGFVDEVKKLVARGDLTLEMPSMRSVGYRQVWEFLLGNYSFDEMVEKGIIATRQLAKRQMTWLRSWPEVVCFDSEDKNVIEKVEGKIKSLI
jgi:tRNA dimethylallyltransferase